MWRSDEPQSDAWWVSTKEFLPDNGEKVLVIDKCGAVHNQMFTDYGLGGKMLFRPDGRRRSCTHDGGVWPNFQRSLENTVRSTRADVYALCMGCSILEADAAAPKGRFVNGRRLEAI